MPCPVDTVKTMSSGHSWINYNIVGGFDTWKIRRATDLSYTSRTFVILRNQVSALYAPESPASYSPESPASSEGNLGRTAPLGMVALLTATRPARSSSAAMSSESVTSLYPSAWSLSMSCGNASTV